MNPNLKKYLFEVIVIFIGITISFLFDGWRKNLEEKKETRKHLIILKNDLGRLNAWIDQIDSTIEENIQWIAGLKDGQRFTGEEMAARFYNLSENPVDFQVRRVSPFLDQINDLIRSVELSNNKNITTHISYIQVLIEADQNLNIQLTDYFIDHTFEKLESIDLFGLVIDYQKNFDENYNSVSFPDKEYTLDNLAGMKKDLDFTELKLRRILMVHDALKRQISRLEESMEKL